jgi:16S rRNA (guanine527-N7)-methyltransferase
VSRNEPAALVRYCREIGIDLSVEETERLVAYLDLLYFWNASAGLTTVSRADAVRVHLVDSLLFVEDLSGASTIADIGTGGGLPGIPLAMVMPGATFDLIESKRRKCSFLREAARELGLANCRVLEVDATTLPDSGRTYDAVVSRAFMRPGEWIPFAARVLRPGGRLLVAAGPELDDRDIETTAADTGLRSVSKRELVLPGGSELRRIFRFDA